MNLSKIAIDSVSFRMNGYINIIYECEEPTKVGKKSLLKLKNGLTRKEIIKFMDAIVTTSRVPAVATRKNALKLLK